MDQNKPQEPSGGPGKHRTGLKAVITSLTLHRRHWPVGESKAVGGIT